MELYEERVSNELGNLETEFVAEDANGGGDSFVPTGTKEPLRSIPSTEVLGYYLPSLSGL